MGSSLVAKLAKASAEVGGKLKADKRNSEQNYAYVSADKILAVCGQALSDNGIIVMPSIVNQEVHATERQGKSPRLDALVEFIFTVTDGEGEFKSSWFGMGSDYMTPDKALYKAITSGHKYFLAKLFAIGEGNEDSEHDPDEKPAPTRIQPDRKPRPAPQAEPVTMTLEEAMSETSGDGTPYGNMATKDLEARTIGINAGMKKPGADVETYNRKLQAIRMILEARANTAPAE